MPAIPERILYTAHATATGGRTANALRITIPGLECTAAEALVATAHQVCPYSNATRGNIEVTLTVA